MGGKTVAVLLGGWSAEREVSLVSGAAVARALAEGGYRVAPIDVPRDLSAFLAALTPRPDVVFNALHGRGGEDGCIQGVLEFLGLPYTHSGIMASAVAMDKPMTKQILAGVGVRSPKGLALTPEMLEGGGHPLPPPYVVKPTDEGSTVGLVFVTENHPSLAAALATLPGGLAGVASRRYMIEEYIPGRELTAGVMGDRALAVTEIAFEGAVFDYTHKYTAGHAHHIIPAEIPAEITAEVLRQALVVHRTLGCEGVSRSDFRWDASRPGVEGLYFLEVNNQPGMTPLSLVPEQAAHCGISYVELVSWLVENAHVPPR